MMDGVQAEKTRPVAEVTAGGTDGSRHTFPLLVGVTPRERHKERAPPGRSARNCDTHNVRQSPGKTQEIENTAADSYPKPSTSRTVDPPRPWPPPRLDPVAQVDDSEPVPVPVGAHQSVRDPPSPRSLPAGQDPRRQQRPARSNTPASIFSHGPPPPGANFALFWSQDGIEVPPERQAFPRAYVVPEGVRRTRSASRRW